MPSSVQASTLTYQGPVQALQASWSYEGETGPEHWGELDESYAMCSIGEQQSPIALSYSNLSSTKWPLINTYQPTTFSVQNNGHTIQADVHGSTGSTLRLAGVPYTLAQFHFHTPSEHTLEDEHFEMELHLVHVDKNDNLAVLGVLMEEGAHHEALDQVWDLMPTEEGTATETVVLDPNDFIPGELNSFQYEGSLTTPPCDEGVKWTVLDEPIEVSREQLDRFQSIYPSNYRPVQDLGNREVGYHYH
ncbi:carbonic anhydrase [Shouchella miscanthi]|uniref:Carbonic anhydrase n=1 Tax=Shouchella miscanthi TaxID=2598861 RepID=A0ABU6NUW0_9BACI|nr:carbonic anhydrase family protein [Shouchella miscanthi]MED4130592.1 carbonic anhydrase family protein [Shouchella miscanthi]